MICSPLQWITNFLWVKTRKGLDLYLRPWDLKSSAGGKSLGKISAFVSLHMNDPKCPFSLSLIRFASFCLVLRQSGQLFEALDEGGWERWRKRTALDDRFLITWSRLPILTGSVSIHTFRIHLDSVWEHCIIPSWGPVVTPDIGQGYTLYLFKFIFTCLLFMLVSLET